MNRWYARRHWIALGCLALLALDAALYFGWVRRPASAPELDPAQLERVSQEVAALRAEVARLDRVREQFPRFRPQVEKFASERLLPERTGSSRIAAELNEAAENAGVVLSSVNYQGAEERAQPDLVRVDVSGTIEGQYPQLLRYLEELERSPHFYLLNELTLESSTGGQVRLQVRLATYFRRGAA